MLSVRSRRLALSSELRSAMTMGAKDRRDFWSAVGEEFGEAVVPPVSFADASPQACCEIVADVLGEAIDPPGFAALSGGDLERVAEGFATFLACEKPDAGRLEVSVRRLLARWPAEPRNFI